MLVKYHNNALTQGNVSHLFSDDTLLLKLQICGHAILLDSASIVTVVGLSYCLLVVQSKFAII